jgi:hypothetical protein
LKSVVLRGGGDGRSKGRKTVDLKFAISVHENQYPACRDLSSSISGGGNSGVVLSDDCQRVTIDPVADEFGSSFFAAVVHDNYFKTGTVCLLLQGS